MNKHNTRNPRKATKHVDTEALFKKQVNVSSSAVILVITSMVLNGVVQAIHGSSFNFFLPALMANAILPLSLSINLLIFAIIGKDKGTDNSIMSFVFGICTIPICGWLFVDKLLGLPDVIFTLGLDIQGIFADPINVADASLRVSTICAIVAVLVLCIAYIVHDARIIKENKPTSRQVKDSNFQIVDAPATANGKRTTTRQCRGCGAAIESMANFCQKCGAKLG